MQNNIIHSHCFADFFCIPFRKMDITQEKPDLSCNVPSKHEFLSCNVIAKTSSLQKSRTSLQPHRHQDLLAAYRPRGREQICEFKNNASSHSESKTHFPFVLLKNNAPWTWTSASQPVHNKHCDRYKKKKRKHPQHHTHPLNPALCLSHPSRLYFFGLLSSAQ